MFLFLLADLLYTVCATYFLNSLIDISTKILKINKITGKRKLFINLVFSVVYYITFYIVETGSPSTVFMWQPLDLFISITASVGSWIIILKVFNKFFSKSKSIDM